MSRSVRFLLLFAISLLMAGCATLPETTAQVLTTSAELPTQTQIPSPTAASHSTTATDFPETPTANPEIEDHDCSVIERLSTDSVEAQRILDEFITNYKEQYPTEYMGMAVLHRVNRLGEWAVVTGSIAGEGTDVIAVRQSSRGYQIAEMIHIFPLEAPEELETWVIQPFLDKLPEAPAALFNCMEQSWLQPDTQSSQAGSVYRLAYVSTDDNTTSGVTEINTIQSDGSNRTTILREPMLIMGLVTSPDGTRIAFWGCPGSLSSDCFSGGELHVWVVGWDGTDLQNLTEASLVNASHPDWSPDGKEIVFQSDLSDRADIYIINANGSGLHQITNGQGYNREPKWSPDGKWIAYYCTQGSGIEMRTQICVISPEGIRAGEPLDGSRPYLVTGWRRR